MGREIYLLYVDQHWGLRKWFAFVSAFRGVVWPEAQRFCSVAYQALGTNARDRVPFKRLLAAQCHAGKGTA